MKRILFFIVVIASFVIINNLIHSIYNLSQKKDLITKTKDQLTREQQENARLKKLVSQAEQPQFVEEEARNKLQMVKPGEQIVIVPTSAPEETGVNRRNRNGDPKWKQWIDLFL